MTTADLQDYIGVIEQMKNLINSAEFDQVFALLTSDLPKSKQFLLKMELKRMAQPCDYFIDLRGQVDGDVRPYPYKDKVHYMDDNAIRIFEAGLKQYGQYTQGLYEEIQNTDNNFRVMHRKETEQRIKAALEQLDTTESAADFQESDPIVQQYFARLLQFGRYSVRNEERMNFSADVEVVMENDRFLVSTTDLSVSGCRLKVAKGRNPAVGQALKLVFKGLEQEFVIDTQAGIPYEIIDTESSEKFDYWRLKRLDDQDDAAFTDFLQSFIQANKRRYKVNLDNTADAVIVKGYEQFYVPRLSGLPVYIAVRDGYTIPVYALTTDYNKATWHYFLDEQQQAVLINILSGKRLKQLLHQHGPELSTILYCFTHAAKGSLYFYSATTEELNASPQLKTLFLGFGATKKSWRVFHLNLLRTSAKNSISPLSLPAQATGKEPSKSALPPALIRPLLKEIRYIACLTDITTNTATLWYQSYNFKTEQLRQLAQFAHSRLKNAPSCEAIPVQYVNLRSESRYLYKTSVEILHNDQILTAFTRDFSARGMQIETAVPVSFRKGDILGLTLPDMQQLSDRYVLSNLQYEVVAVSKSHSIMNLRALESEEQHTGKLFFQRLIQNNRSKLTPAEETPRYPGLSGALRNMYLSTMNSFAFYLHRKGIRYELTTIAEGSSKHRLHQLLPVDPENSNQLNISLLLKNNTANLKFATQLKSMKRFDMPKSYELYIRVPAHTDTAATDAVSYYDYEFDSEQAKQAFIIDALQHAKLYGFRIFLSRTGRPDMDYIARELSYISSYALHKAKGVEEELWSVAGVGDVTDISKELPERFGAGLLNDA
ncbi:PilZ domain-containing protein [Chromatiaceae bacterium AAb-1]|nr:PilZ domain-containing protein [Chromatiaceae bacterium AAb-1]